MSKKDENFSINLLRSIELEKILKVYFRVHGDNECGNHKLGLELYEILEWVTYT